MTTHTKIPPLLYSYLATEMLAPFFASFLIMNCVFFLAKLIPFLNFVLELNIGFADFIRLFSYLFPNIFLYSIPMATMMGVTIGFTRLSNDSEILAFKASGISIYQIIPPVVIVTTLIALLTSYFSIKLIPLSEVAMKQLTYQLLKEKVNKGIKPHVFTEALGDVVVYVEQIDKKSGEWTDVWVSDMRGVENPVITMASKGSMKSSIQDMKVSIVLYNGSLHRPSSENSQIVEFDKYQINIPLRPPQSKATRVKRKNVLTMQELLAEADRIEENTVSKRKILIEFHKRLVLPGGCLLMSLLGLPLGLQARAGKKAIGIQAGLAIFILYYILFTMGKSMAEEAVLPVIIAMWAPNSLFFILALFWIYRVANEKPLIPGFISELYRNILNTTSTSLKKTYKVAIRRAKGFPDSLGNDEETVALGTRKLISGNAKSRVFHVPECEYYSCRNCTLEFKDVHVAQEAGFEPCRFCRHLMDL
ncbi:MAG: LPS export ABC transporter permease LptF [Desulfobulbaceae bacterium]|nr:LPS export ABC transporter permease LptF [Desulfobulbaceae bacterium]